MALRRITHKTIAAVTEALESFAFNVAVARLYEFANVITDAERSAVTESDLDWARREAVEMLARLSAPMMPHLAEELMALLNPATSSLVADQAWPEAEPELLIADSVTIAVQIMGKLRGTVAMPPDSPAETVIAAAEAEPHVAQALKGKRIVRRIHVANRIVNFVIAG
jgi:leucyl-tRNA synthetase